MLKKIFFFYLVILFSKNIFAYSIFELSDKAINSLPAYIQLYLKDNNFILGREIANRYLIDVDIRKLYDYTTNLLANSKTFKDGLFFLGVLDYTIFDNYLLYSKIDINLLDSINCKSNSLKKIDSIGTFINQLTQNVFITSTVNKSNISLEYNNQEIDYLPIYQKQYCKFINSYKSLLTSILINSKALKNYFLIETNSYNYYLGNKLLVNFNYNTTDNFTITLKTSNSESYIDYNSKTFESIIDFNTTPDNYTIKVYDNNEIIQEHTVSVKEFNVDYLDKLTFSPFILKIQENKISKGYKIIYPFDFIFVGGYPDDIETELDESLINKVIPGNFTHLIVYLGRLEDGTPIAAELTTSLYEKTYYLRIINIPDLFENEFDSSKLDLPLVTVNIYKYLNVDAKRLQPADINNLLDNKDLIFKQIKTDIIYPIDYQYQFYWSYNLLDRNIYLIDDGLENGASCTDYWLSIYEDYANICITGSRINAEELIDYFINDPSGKNVELPETFNPFPFTVSMKDIVNKFNFKLYNPLPHKFSCNDSEETGISIPTNLFYSNDLLFISFVE